MQADVTSTGDISARTDNLFIFSKTAKKGGEVRGGGYFTSHLFHVTCDQSHCEQCDSFQAALKSYLWGGYRNGLSMSMTQHLRMLSGEKGYSPTNDTK